MLSATKYALPLAAALALVPGSAGAISCDDCPPPPPPQVNHAPIAEFDFPAQLVRAQGSTLVSTSTDPDEDAVSVLGWDLDGDGTYTDAAGQDSANVSFTTLGDHTVGLKVTDGKKTATVTHVISVVNRRPTVTLKADKTNALTSEDVTFDATGSDPDGDAVHYEWPFAGGSFIQLSGSVLDETNKVGEEVVKVRAVDALGAVSDVAQVTIQRANRPPVGTVVTGAQQPFTGQNVDFDASGSTDKDGSIVSYQWFFDADDTVDATGPKASTSFARPGQRTVKLLLTDDLGAKTIVDVPLTVRNRVPTASFTSSATTVATAAEVTFDGSGSSDPETTIARYEWDFDGDGVYETDNGATATIKHAFAGAGAKTVGLRVTDADGGTATATAQITVTAPAAGTPAPIPTPTPGGGTTPTPTPTPVVTQPAPTPAPAAPTAPLTAKFKRAGKKVKVVTLSTTPPAGTAVTVTCSGKGCGFASRTLAATGAVVDLKPLFAAALKKGAKVTVTLTKDGLRGSAYRFTVGKRGAPKVAAI